jgi:hypothetical protein
MLVNCHSSLIPAFVHSALSVIIGLTREALRAGSQQATIEAAISTSVTVA